jgi:hypothetical protein
MDALHCSEQTLNIPNKDFRSRVRFAGDEGEEEFCSDDEFPDYLVDEADFPSYQQKGRGKAKRPAGDEDGDSDGGFAGQDAGASKGAVGSLSEEAREALELQFERTLAEYDDEEIGYLEEVSSYLASRPGMSGQGLYILTASMTRLLASAARGGYGRHHRLQRREQRSRVRPG